MNIINPFKSAAIEYALMGFKILPVEPRKKQLLKNSFYKKPTSDLNIIDYWWKIKPDANIAIPLSVRNNSLIVLDLDVDNVTNGLLSLEDFLKSTNQDIPSTLSVNTGSGGLHLYFKNVRKVVQRGKQNILPLVDIRSEDAYVVAPPSIHKNGCSYKINTGTFNSIADANDTVYNLLEMCNHL